MSLLAKNTGGDFEITPEGTYIGRCFKVIDLGTQTVTGIYGTNSQHKIMVVWELLDDKVKMADGRPYAATQWYTASLNEKARLRKDLEAWRGKRFDEKELEGFDLQNVLGAYCMIQIVHSTDGKYANINSIMAFKGDKPAAVNPNVAFDIDNPDMEVFEAFSDAMKGKIMSAPEWEAAKQKSDTEQVHEVQTDGLSDPFADNEPPDFVPDDVYEPTEEDLQGNIELPDLEDKPKAKVKK